MYSKFYVEYSTESLLCQLMLEDSDKTLILYNNPSNYLRMTFNRLQNVYKHSVRYINMHSMDNYLEYIKKCWCFDDVKTNWKTFKEMAIQATRIITENKQKIDKHEKFLVKQTINKK